jgi:hypothetical protein
LNLFEKNSEDKIKSSSGRNKASSTFTLNLEDEEKELIEHFLICSIDLINSNYSIVTSISQQTPTSGNRWLSETNEPKTFEVKKKTKIKNIFLFNTFFESNRSF